MTTAKADRGIPERRPYSYASGYTDRGCNHTMPTDEIRELFISVGWLGQLDGPVEYIRAQYSKEVSSLNGDR